MVSDAEGEVAVRLARAAISAGLERPEGWDAATVSRDADLPAVFAEPRGVFVTLRRHPSGTLRGCIGFPSPVFPIRVALPRAAWAAARDDPRFPPVGPSELPRLSVEVSLLTVPEIVPEEDPNSIPRWVEVGRHGLIVERAGASGLLLPQVAGEFGWNAEQFLAATCEKAGLAPGAWRRPGTHVRRFEGEVFEETTPGGAVHRAAMARSD